MIGLYTVAAVALVAMGITVGYIVVVSLGIHREKKYGSFTGESPDRLVSGARASCGVYTRQPGVSQQTRSKSIV